MSIWCHLDAVQFTTKLEGPSNWNEWLKKIELHIEVRGLAHYIHKPGMRSSRDNYYGYRKFWEDEDLKVKKFLTEHLGDQVLQDLKNSGWTTKNTAHETFLAIKKIVFSCPDANDIDKIKDLFELFTYELTTLDEFLEDLEKACAEITIVPKEVRDAFFTVGAMLGIKESHPDEYKELESKWSGKAAPNKNDMVRIIQSLPTKAGVGVNAQIAAADILKRKRASSNTVPKKKPAAHHQLAEGFHKQE